MATGWQIALDDLKAGKGGYYVPDPSPTSDCQSLLAIRDKQIGFRDDIKNRLKDFKKASSINPMMEIIRILNSNIEKYQAAYDQCSTAVASQPVPADPLPTSVPTIPANVNNDPILQSATPSGSTATAAADSGGGSSSSGSTQGSSTSSAGPGGAQGGGTSSAAGTTAGPGGTTPAAKSMVEKAFKGSVAIAGKKVPKWALWAAGVIAAGTIAYVAFGGKKKKAVANG